MALSRPVVIGVTGGSGSGKTTVSHEIFNRLQGESVVMLAQDAYYNDQTDLTMAQRRTVNYDHPDSFDTALMVQHLKQLINREAIQEPIYDYVESNRAKETQLVEPADVIIAEGVLLFVDPELRDLLDIKIYVDTDDDIRFIRRLQRDMVERGRSADSVIQQYLATVKPMHHQFVEPTKRYADVIIPEGGENLIAINMLESQIRAILNPD
ncbi:uridine kinase [Weissella diestrammenae]|uniref:Uridine kinase n=1 Tax=Weissella diestrammenae TaxID=1162633 RepID=A0A7G9T5K9_9LACO|nr:uridine kinase [Weissella diestrammenae]MCM0582211.1 uridine kinase [Weissella diestrammenae]QNN75384.1 uridine kinase [Weissella diestrammenae]